MVFCAARRRVVPGKTSSNKWRAGGNALGRVEPQSAAHEKPRTVSGRGSGVDSVGRSGSEVTLSANVEGHGVLVLGVGGGRWVGGRRGERGGAGEILIEVGGHGFGRERQVLDRSPAGDHTKLRYVVVRVAAEIRGSIRGRQLVAGDVIRAVLALGRGDIGGAAVISHRRPASEQAGRPVWIPVVVERTADTIGRGQLEIAGTAENGRKIHGIRGRTEAKALVGAIAAAEHREARRRAAGGDHVLGSPLAKDASTLISSPAPVGIFLMFKAAITEPPHLVSGWP